MCRICRDSGPEVLHHPCKCSGTVALVHASCLRSWLSYSHKEACELCRHRFRFEPVLAPDAPARLPNRELALAAAVMALQWLPGAAQVALIAVLWAWVIPLSTAWIFRGWVHPRSIFDGG